jgi:hypothetical protein
MANALYDKAREGFLSGQINWSSDNIKAVLVDTALYSPSLSTHQYLSDIASGARVATSANLATKTVTNGVADAADITFSAVTGASIEAIVLYKDTGTAGTSRLICYIDSGVGGIPITPNGGDIATAWNASGIFKL